VCVCVCVCVFMWLCRCVCVYVVCVCTPMVPVSSQEGGQEGGQPNTFRVARCSFFELCALYAECVWSWCL